ncbi:adrenocorticotropic hormone receptor-like [Clytia hemisphaerica]|uniref:G-protein coupled receptors family 1 profile domain-containing protein n=1 Tax=Clytia hemisphaerica TaxID=252671 RepID=A0A7M5WVX3_9CNID
MVLEWFIPAIVLDVMVIVANFAQQLIIFRKWSSIDRIDHLLLSLSISDLISGLVMLLTDSYIMHEHLTGMMNQEQTAFSKIVDMCFDSVFVFSIFASIFHVISVAVERLWAIKFPRKYYIFTTFKMKCGTISLIWCLSLTLTVLFSALNILSTQEEIGTFIRGVVFAGSAILVFVTYVYIAYLLLQQRRKNKQTFSNESQDRRLRRLTILCLFIGISFVACILPITVGYLDADLYHHSSNLLITLNSLINPFIYFVKVYYESRSRRHSITRTRSDTNNALLDTRSSNTVTTDIHDERSEI